MSAPSNALTTTQGELGPVTLDLRGIDREHVDTITEILKDVKLATDRVARAARRWVELPEEVREKVIEGTPRTLHSIWERLGRIGEGRLHPLLYSTFGHAANLLGRLPLTEQEKYLTEKVPVAITNAGGRPDIKRYAVEDLDPQQRLQVFKVAGTGVQVRTVAEQRAWLADQETKRAAKAVASQGLNYLKRPFRWTIDKGRVFIDPVKAKDGLTADDIAQIVRDLKL